MQALFIGTLEYVFQNFRLVHVIQQKNVKITAVQHLGPVPMVMVFVVFVSIF